MLSVIYAEFLKLAHYAECRYGECHYADCRGATLLTFFIVVVDVVAGVVLYKIRSWFAQFKFINKQPWLGIESGSNLRISQ